MDSHVSVKNNTEIMFFSKNRHGEFHPKASNPIRPFLEKKKKKNKKTQKPKSKSSNTCKTSITNPKTKQKLTPNPHKPHAPVLNFFFFFFLTKDEEAEIKTTLI